MSADAPASTFSVAVFCGSRHGGDPAHRELTAAFGAALAKRRWRLIYGGGDVGLMGTLATAAIEAGGEVTGVIPRRLLAREVGKRDVTELVVTETMAERKERMITAAHAFVALPGGLGTLDELLEVMTLRQLGYVTSLIVLVDAAFWRPLVELVDYTIKSGFAQPFAPPLFEVADNLDAALSALEHAAAQHAGS